MINITMACCFRPRVSSMYHRLMSGHATSLNKTDVFIQSMGVNYRRLWRSVHLSWLQLTGNLRRFLCPQVTICAQFILIQIEKGKKDNKNFMLLCIWTRTQLRALFCMVWHTCITCSFSNKGVS